MIPTLAPAGSLPAGRRLVTIITAAALLTASAVSAASAQGAACTPARTALVLGGGGAKGFAHAGVFRALDSLHIRPDIIVGTSSGAIMGALYAAGYSGIDVERIARNLPLSSIIRGYDPELPTVMGNLPVLALWERDPVTGYRLQTGTVREGEINAMMSGIMLKGNLLARGSFDSLPIPFRAVATDLRTRRPVALAKGDLALAVRASFAIPLVFQSVEVDGLPLVDGGLTENVPVNVARALGATRLIISALPSKGIDLSAYRDPLTIASQLGEFLFWNDSIALGPDDILIRHSTEDTPNLDFSNDRADSLFTSGRAAADSALAHARCIRPLGEARTRRMPTRVGTITVADERPVDRMALRRSLHLATGGIIHLDSLTGAVNALGTSQDYSAVWLNPSGRDSTVRFDVTVDRTPSRLTALGMAYDNDMVGRLWVGVAQRGVFGTEYAGGFAGAFGKYRQELTMSIERQQAALSQVMPLRVRLNVANEDVRQLIIVGTDLLELSPINTNEALLSIGVGNRLKDFEWDLAAIGHTWMEPTRGRTMAGGLYGRIRRPLDEENDVFRVEGWVTNEYLQGTLALGTTMTFGGFELRPHVLVGWGQRLPQQRWFTLGAWDGFPGFRTGENRGEHTVLGSLAMRQKLTSIIRLRLDFDAGIISFGDVVLGRQADPLAAYAGTWYYGARLGIEARTPLGRIIVQEGRNNDGRRQLFVRIGRWF